MNFPRAVALVVILCLAALSGLFIESRADAQSEEKVRGSNRSDRDLADAIKSRTNRSSELLKELRGPRGGSMLDLADGFQNVMLAKLGSDGEPIAACVTDLGEANEFFKRDLETGRPVASIDLFETEKEVNAMRHGMSVEEYNFYSGIASEFAAGNLVSSLSGSTFNIVNADGAGEGFNDSAPAFVVGEGGNSGTTRGQQRLNVFNAAAAVWAAFLDSPVPVNISSQFNPIAGCTSGGGVLGSAGTQNVHRNFTGAQFGSTWYHAALANKLAGTDLAPGSPEIRAQFNTDVDSSCLGGGSRFYYGLDNATPSGRVNLFVVVLHEIGHGVGFSSFVDGGTGSFLGSPANADIYSRYMYDATLGLHWNEMTDAQRRESALNNNNVFWNGPSVRSASSYLTAGVQPGTGRVTLYTPNPLRSGSSISHFGTAAFPNLLMEPSITPGLPLDLDLSRQVMRDIGWFPDATLDGVPDTISNVQPSGSSVTAGQIRNIVWANNGGFSRNVTIELSLDGGNTYSPIATNITNSGSFPWTVPAAATSQARIRVREAGYASPAGVSTSAFAIQAQPASTSMTVAGRILGRFGKPPVGARITLTSPTGVIYSDVANPMGYFMFPAIPPANGYVVKITVKGAQYAPSTLNVTGNLSGLEYRPL